MFRYLPVFAAIVVLLNIIVIIFRLNHWRMDPAFNYISWGLLVILCIVLIYYTWHKENSLAVTSMIMWTFGIGCIPVLIIPWWFMRVYPKLKQKID